MSTMSKPVCLITGVGGGTGSALAHRFTRGGYRVAMIARNQERLTQLECELVDSRSYVCDVSDLDALMGVIHAMQSEMGDPSILIHNAVSATFSTFMEANPEDLERNFRVNATALLYLSQALSPAMVNAARGSIMVTGNTASLRGVPNYALFAPTKAAQRILAQSLARDLGPKGVHVGYITIDGAINSPWLGDESRKPDWLKAPEDWPGNPEDFFVKPEAIAEEVFHLVHQDRSTWSFDHIIRPFGEKW